MRNLTAQGASAPTFTPSAWLANWSDNGGIAFVVNGRLFLSRPNTTGASIADAIDELHREIVADRRNGEALADFLRNRSFGEGM